MLAEPSPGIAASTRSGPPISGQQAFPLGGSHPGCWRHVPGNLDTLARGLFLLAGMHPRDLSVTVDRMTVRCVIVDDNSVFVAAARRLLEQQGLAVLGVAANGEDALRLAADLRPDVLLVDIDLDGESGLDVVRRLACAVEPPPLAILISTHAEDVYADLVAESAAVGFLSKAELSATAVQGLLEGRVTG